ncbi:glyoxalase [Aeromicrobium sp. PE09-221]|uniref:VOC family protein n=1 Tax=Aeromicrobium sp. PE09-221 TaxID=1898043 RepID=UPI000B3E785E|nr:VOC family protein [Aeromicrobium sp. PE09-221]OUZ12506.1 glyoxalase [Aeromicrobium sp. PE09-221]
MSLRPVMITCDSTDPLPLGRWWADQTGGEVIAENDGWFSVVQLSSGPRLAFQKVDDPTPGKNRVHLDLEAEGDLDAEAERLVTSGAERLNEQTMGGFRWIVMADPDGNLFCISSAH